MFGHDFFQESNTVHARHFHVEHEHVRPLALHGLHGEDRIGHRTDNLDFRVLRQHCTGDHQFANQVDERIELVGMHPHQPVLAMLCS